MSLQWSFRATVNAVFQFAAHSLGAASQSIKRNAKRFSQRQPIINLVASFIPIVFQYQLTAFGRQVAQALFKTLASRIGFFEDSTFCSDCGKIIEADCLFVWMSQ